MKNAQHDGNQFEVMQKQVWMVATLAMVVGIMGMHFLVNRPVKQQMALMQHELSGVQNELKLLTGTRSSTSKANTLLSELRLQKRQLLDAQRSLTEIRNLRQQVQDEASKSALSMESINQLAQVHKSLDQIVALKNRINQEADSVEDAECRLRQLGNLKSQVLTEAKGLDTAKMNVEKMIAITDNINNTSADLQLASTNARRMIDVKEMLVMQGGNNDSAKANLSSLLQLRDTVSGSDASIIKAHSNASHMLVLVDNLSSKKVDPKVASKNLDQLIEIHTQLKVRSRSIADAVQTFELLSDLQDEITGYSQSLQEIRKTMLELILLEGTVSRVARILKPMTELGNLRRLGDQEVRAAARTIMQNRSSRYSKKSSPAVRRFAKTEAKKTTSNQLVPMPITLD